MVSAHGDAHRSPDLRGSQPSLQTFHHALRHLGTETARQHGELVATQASNEVDVAQLLLKHPSRVEDEPVCSRVALWWPTAGTCWESCVPTTRRTRRARCLAFRCLSV